MEVMKFGKKSVFYKSDHKSWSGESFVYDIGYLMECVNICGEDSV